MKLGIFRIFLYPLGRFVCFVFLKFNLSYKVFGRENIPTKGPFIIASNHVSYLDPPLVGVGCPRQLNFMARETLFHNRIFGWMLRNIGVIPLRRHGPDISSVKEALWRLKRGEGLGLFPEGTRSVDGSLRRAFEGVGFLARKSGAATIPAYVQGTEKALPKGEKKVRRVPVAVFYGKPVTFPEGRTISDRERTELIMAAITQLRNTY